MSDNLNTITNIAKALQERVNAVLEDDSVIVYDTADFLKLTAANNALREGDKFVAVMYLGMASNKSATGGKSTTGRFMIVVSFGNDKARIRGLDEPTDMFPFLTELRKAIQKDTAPNGQRFTFVSEIPTPFERFGDGYSQQWSVPMTTDS